MAKVAIIIPARYASTRFPGKPLAQIHGHPMIEYVYKKALKVRGVNDVIVATDDERIKEAVRLFGGKVVMTSESCASGTDRVAEAALSIDADIVVNVQGDEPAIEPLAIEKAIEPLLKDDNLPMATLMAPIRNEAELDNINIVKVVGDLQGNALYFSRSLIPNSARGNKYAPHKHIGLYVYRRDFLLKISKLPKTPLEETEQLEQLRVLENGYKIRLVEIAESFFGVDTPEQLKQIEALLPLPGEE
jgi:3-deoxy-manno-octulosonate cytidylyltransferase (CMP-KDO synthetase)